MIGAIVKQLIGLFVDDGLLAAAILCVVGFVSVLTLSGAEPAWLAGLLLTLALPAALAASVLRSARRATRSK
jgi:hydrogenase maturation factor